MIELQNITRRILELFPLFDKGTKSNFRKSPLSFVVVAFHDLHRRRRRYDATKHGNLIIMFVKGVIFLHFNISH